MHGREISPRCHGLHRWMGISECARQCPEQIIYRCMETEACVCVCMCAQLLQSCLTLCDPMDCSPPGSSVHGILQARILERIATASSRGLPTPGIKPTSLMSSALAGGFFTTRTTWETHSGILFSHRKNEIMPLAAIWMQLEIITLSEVIKRKTNTMISLICGSKIWHR